MWVAFVKHKIGEFSRDFGAKLKKAKTLIKTHIEKELDTLANDLTEQNIDKYKELKKQLDDIIEQEIKGSILRSLCTDYENGEKYYLQGLAIEPNHIGINEYLGELYVATNRLDLANERLKILENCNCEEYKELKQIIDGTKKSKY